jgi:hypothetical protein
MSGCLSQADHMDPGFVVRVGICMHHYHNHEPSAHSHAAERAPAFLAIDDTVPDGLRQRISQDPYRKGEVEPVLAQIAPFLLGAT